MQHMTPESDKTILTTYLREIDRLLSNLPNLEVIPLDMLVMHEIHDGQRTPPLVKSLTKTGVLRNPPIVAPLGDGTGRYMVLDGANRTTAFKQMGFDDILAQVAIPGTPGLQMNTWNHVIWQMETEKFLEGLRAIEALNIEIFPGTQEEALELIWEKKIQFYFQTPEQTIYTAATKTKNLADQVAALRELMGVYKEDSRFDRSRNRSVVPLLPLYPDLTGLLVYPHFKVYEVLKLASEGHLFPAGVTRFIVGPRALRINYPIAKLKEDKTLEEKNQELQVFIQQKVTQKSVRFYIEPTVLFDE